MELVAISRTVEGAGVVVAALVIFGGSTLLLVSAIFGLRMGYLITATSFFGFMIILSALWSFGAPGTPPFLGPKGELPHWVGTAEGVRLSSSRFPIVAEYPGGPWLDPKTDPALQAEVDAAATVFQEFLAEEANKELLRAQPQTEAEIEPEDFEVTDVRFAKVDDTDLAMARGFFSGGGPEVLVVGFKDPGNESLPSYIYLVMSVIGFAVHLPFIDRAEKKRKQILTGGEQQPWRGPA